VRHITLILFPEEAEQGDRLASVNFTIHVIRDLSPGEFFPQQSKETFICLSPFLVTKEDLDRFVRYEIGESLD